MSAARADAGELDGGRGWPADAWRGPLLAVRLSSLGDVVLTTGPLGLLRRRRPELQIELLTRRAYAPALSGNPDGCRVRLAEAPMAPPGRYATVLDWQGGLRGRRVVRRAAPGARRVGAPRANVRRRLLVCYGARIPPPEPFVVRLARSIAGRAIPCEQLAPRIVADAEGRQRVGEQLAAAGTPEAGWAALAPGAAHREKAIPEALCAELAAGLEASGWGVVRIDPPGSGAPPAAWVWEAGRRRGRFQGGLAALIALLAEVGLFLGSDSGLLHLASGVGTPAVGLYGSTSPALGYPPLGRARAIGVDLACRPCHIHGADRCWLGHRRCWREMRAADVWAAIRELLPEAPVPRPGALGARGAKAPTAGRV